MDKVRNTNVESFYHFYPTLVAVITSHGSGCDNVMPAAWHSPISRKPPIYGVSVAPSRYTHELITASREFVVNFLPGELAELVAKTGAVSGRDIDKFLALHIDREPALKVSAPVLGRAYAAYECRLLDRRTYGDHDWFVGEVVAVHYSREAFPDGDILALKDVSPILYMGAETYLFPDPDTLQVLDRQVYRRALLPGTT